MMATNYYFHYVLCTYECVLPESWVSLSTSMSSSSSSGSWFSSWALRASCMSHTIFPHNQLYSFLLIHNYIYNHARACVYKFMHVCEFTDLCFKLFLVHISVFADQHSVGGGLSTGLCTPLTQTHSDKQNTHTLITLAYTTQQSSHYTSMRRTMIHVNQVIQ